MEESVPLLGGERHQRTTGVVVRVVLGIGVFVSSLVVVSRQLSGPPPSAGVGSQRMDSESSSSSSSMMFAPPPAVVAESWGVGFGADRVFVEEHYLFSTGLADLGLSSHIFLKQAYTYWRYGLNGPRAMRHEGARAIEVASYRYNSKTAFMNALEKREVGRGALVFISVTAMTLDLEIRDLDALTSPPYNLERSNILQSDDEDIRSIESLCAYTYTPDLMLRSRTLRALFAYPEPLVLVLAGDSACRLTNIPATHHAVVFPNDGAPTALDDYPRGDVLWYPEGLEGLEDPADRLFWMPSAEANALKLTDAPLAPLEDRPFLFDCGMSVNGRKPSRAALVTYLEEGGGEAALAALAEEAGRAVRVDASVIDMPVRADDGSIAYAGPYARFHSEAGVVERDDGGDARAVFALAPAGDTWSSGRTLEAMLRGAIPVVDATYKSDGGASAKGCGDAARFWRDGAEGIGGAPFVFVEDWTDLPDLLRAAGATNATQLQKRLDAVQAYRDELERYLRTSILDLVLARQRNQDLTTRGTQTRCETTPLSSAQVRAQRDAQKAYYDSDWLNDFVDKPSLPTGACTTQYHTHFTKTSDIPVIPSAGPHAPCFDAACAPPLVGSFACASVSLS
ncbi:hypothetical protein CTAYLR_001225 [Chrysophaeum taylorii]|uniref:RXYLT1 C-terminal domain-containing protein n=1 Tax=Chrysophaeum taylorii TaxID=2483200 RepID=A0AAD7UCK4_9STRA|nr:hypothetical protein CTAYLR_001225 [Chrysophaeum taylorii]